MRLRRTAVALTALALLAAACSDGGTPAGDSTGSPAGQAASQVNAQVASFDVAVGQDQRLLVGLFGPDRGVIGGGEVEVRVGRLPEGGQSADTDVALSEPVTASFLPVPGKEPEGLGDVPQVIPGSGAGVYEAAVDLDQPGTWGVHVTVPLEGQDEPVTAQAVFPVAEEHAVPAVGDPAPPTDTPTIDTAGVDPSALDSRAQGEDAEVPDPELHDASIAEAIEAGRPTVVVISTPVYCVSQFCGPITDTISELSGQYDDRAEFVHVEVWEDYQAHALNPAVEEWIFDPATGGQEPWVFLVGADGTIRARWDNVLDEQELVGMLEELPTS